MSSTSMLFSTGRSVLLTTLLTNRQALLALTAAAGCSRAQDSETLTETELSLTGREPDDRVRQSNSQLQKVNPEKLDFF